LGNPVESVLHGTNLADNQSMAGKQSFRSNNKTRFNNYSD